MPISILLVEDDAQLRENLSALLATFPEYHLIAAYASAEEALAKTRFESCDILLTDIGLPGMSGIELIKKIKSYSNHTLCLILTVFEDEQHVFGALKAGAVGYILKGSRSTKIIDALDEVVAGGSPMTGTIARKVMESFHQKTNMHSPLLTDRENQLLDHLSQGLRYKEIAEAFHISVETVRTHIRNIYQKLQVQSRTEALNKLRDSK